MVAAGRQAGNHVERVATRCCVAGCGRRVLAACHADPLRVEMESFEGQAMIRKLKNGDYRLYSRKLNPKTGKRRNLGTFRSRREAEQHEREVQFFKRGG